MTAGQPIINLPVDYTYGLVVGRIVDAEVDSPDDVDHLPQGRPALGKVRFTPDKSLRKTVDYPALVNQNPFEVDVSPDTGRIVSPDGYDGVWLFVGIWKVEFLAPLKISPYYIEVTAAHTEAAPLDLAVEAPYVPPSGVMTQALPLPLGGVTGQTIVKQADGTLGWANAAAGSADWSTLSGKPSVIAAGNTAALARSAIGAVGSVRVNGTTVNPDGTGLVDLGTIAAGGASTMAQLTDVDATGAAAGQAVIRQGDGTYKVEAVAWANVGGKPAVIASGADAAAARSAIGAGTSSLAIGTTGTTAKAGNWTPASTDISDATTVGRSVVTAATQAAARTAIGAGTSNLAVGATAADAKAGDWTPAIADVVGLTAALASKANTADVTTALADKISAADAPELIADTIGSSVTAGDGISTDYDDAAGTTTVAVAIPDWRARTVTAVTGAAPRIGLTVTVAYNDATSAWPSIDGGLLADPNVAIHWLGGPASATPPASAGPGVWYQQVS